MATQEEKQAYIDEMVRKRGYVLDYHKVMTHYDFDVLQAANGLVEAAYLKSGDSTARRRSSSSSSASR